MQVGPPPPPPPPFLRTHPIQLPGDFHSATCFAHFTPKYLFASSVFLYLSCRCLKGGGPGTFESSNFVPHMGVCTCRCQLIGSCCNKPYVCRHCHDEAEDHRLEAAAVTDMVCMECGHQQPPAGVTLHCLPGEAQGGAVVSSQYFQQQSLPQFHESAL